MPRADEHDGFPQRLGALKRKVVALKGQARRVRERVEGRAATTSGKQRAVVDRSKCTGCGICQEVCPQRAVRVTYVANVNAERCTGCGVCVQNCPHAAIGLASAGIGSSRRAAEQESA